MEERIFEIKGFDSEGEPELRQHEDGSVSIMFNFMPPLNGDEEQSEDERFDEFDEYLSLMLGVEVIWEDRELFNIPNPTESTIENICLLLNNFWSNLQDEV